ncbi:MAG: hypothetical protein HC923_03600 [Myxococcales bacterium]|nr:hypothetical protein [Myxococcales bacterium]
MTEALDLHERSPSSKPVDVVIVDHYDSFTFNLAQAFATLGSSVEVVACDRLDVKTLEARTDLAVVVGPGPGRADLERDVGRSRALLQALPATTPVLGVCLGIS